MPTINLLYPKKNKDDDSNNNQSNNTSNKITIINKSNLHIKYCLTCYENNLVTHNEKERNVKLMDAGYGDKMKQDIVKGDSLSPEIDTILPGVTRVATIGDCKFVSVKYYFIKLQYDFTDTQRNYDANTEVVILQPTQIEINEFHKKNIVIYKEKVEDLVKIKGQLEKELKDSVEIMLIDIRDTTIDKNNAEKRRDDLNSTIAESDIMISNLQLREKNYSEIKHNEINEFGKYISHYTNLISSLNHYILINENNIIIN